MSRAILHVKKSSLIALKLRYGILLQKGGALPPRSIRVWGGKEYIKAGPGDWRPLVEWKEHWDSSSKKAKELKISDFGTPDEVREMAKMPKSAVSFTQAREILENMVNKPMTSRSGLSATLSKKSIKEILGGEAVGKSFDLKAHLKAAANLEKLYPNAIEKWEFELDPNKNNDSLKDRKYLYAPMEYKGRIIPVKLTVKEYKDIWSEKRLYSIEAIDVEVKI
jgi:hypothetical protein